LLSPGEFSIAFVRTAFSPVECSGDEHPSGREKLHPIALKEAGRRSTNRNNQFKIVVSEESAQVIDDRAFFEGLRIRGRSPSI
jgi:hypothetical protein